jgi:hypothetical protein
MKRPALIHGVYPSAICERTGPYPSVLFVSANSSCTQCIYLINLLCFELFILLFCN